MACDRNALQGVLNVTTVARARADGWDGTVTAAIASATHRSNNSFEYFDGLAEVRLSGAFPAFTLCLHQGLHISKYAL